MNTLTKSKDTLLHINIYYLNFFKLLSFLKRECFSQS